MAEIQSRAARRRPGRAEGTIGTGRRVVTGSVQTAPLRRLRPLGIPEPRSARPGASFLKRTIQRLTAWEIDPIVGQVNRLQQATIEAVTETPKLVDESVGP